MANGKIDKALQQLLKLGIEVKMVWSNASPTSKFGSQTISLDLSGYDYVFIRWRWSISDPDMIISPIKIGTESLLSGVANYRQTRDVMVKTSGLTFGAGANALYNASLSPNSEVAIPVEIYAAKFLGGGYSLIQKLKHLFTTMGRRCFTWQTAR